VVYTQKGIFIDSLEELLPISRFYAYFICPNCSDYYRVECNPARAHKSTSLCKSCQKKWLHKFLSYRKAYECSMLKKHGVKRPIQSKRIREKMQKTMIKNHGVPFSMQSKEVQKKHAFSVLKNYSRDNYLRNYNTWNCRKKLDRRVGSKLEQAVASECLNIFGDQSLCVHTKKHKLNHLKKWYSPDFYDPTHNLIIEINGDFFHANPAVYDENKIFLRGQTFKELRKDEIQRYEVLKQYSNVYIVWEYDWKYNKSGVLQMLKEIKHAHDTKTFVSREKLLGWQP